MADPRNPRHSPQLPPVVSMSIAVAIGLSVVLTVILLAHRQSWLGLKLSPSATGNGAIVTGAAGPSAHVPQNLEIVRIASATDSLLLEPIDLTIEPDGSMGDYATYERFLARQSRLARIQNSSEIELTSSDDREFTIIPDQRGRPFATFPPDFWVQLVVGLTAWLVSAAVHAFRPRDTAARYLLLSGAATLLFSPAAAVYTTRELAIDGTIFRWASDFNFFWRKSVYRQLHRAASPLPPSPHICLGRYFSGRRLPGLVPPAAVRGL